MARSSEDDFHSISGASEHEDELLSQFLDGRHIDHGGGNANEDFPTIRMSQSLDLSQYVDDTGPNFSDVTSIEVSLVPLTAQVQEPKMTYKLLQKRKVMGDFLTKRGGMRTNWKVRYFMLTGDHVHYFEPQGSAKGDDISGLSEPSGNSVPLGSISLHSITGNVHKSDLGIVFCFQIPTQTRIYHVKATTARVIEKWLTVLNGNIKRIQGSSIKFPDAVFRIATVWKDKAEKIVLRNGREFQIFDAILSEKASQIPELAQVHLPSELDDPSILPKDQVSVLMSYLKGLLILKVPQIHDIIMQFITDPGSEFFSVNSVQQDSISNQSPLEFSTNSTISAIGLSPLIKEKLKSHQNLIVSELISDKLSSLNYFRDELRPLVSTKQPVTEVDGVVKTIQFTSDGAGYVVNSYIEARSHYLNETNSVGLVKYVGSIHTQFFMVGENESMFSQDGGEFLMEKDPFWACNNHTDTTTMKRRGQNFYLLAKVFNSRSVNIINLVEKKILRSISLDLKGTDSITCVKFSPKEPNIVAIGSDQGILIWDFTKNEFLVTLRHPCASMAFSPDGKKIAAIGPYQSKVKLWEVKTGKRMKKLAPGFSTIREDTSRVFWPHIRFHPVSSQILVLSSYGDLMAWNYNLEEGEETQTVMNVEHVSWSTDLLKAKTDASNPENEAPMVYAKAKSLEAPIYAECRGCVTVFGSRIDFAKYSWDGNIVMSYSSKLKKIGVWLSRNGDHVAEFDINKVKDSSFITLESSADGRWITYSDGENIVTRQLPLDKNGDLLEHESKENVDDDVSSVGWVPRHIENDPMVPYYEHQLMTAISENNLEKVKKIQKTYNLNLNFHSIMEGMTPLLLASKLGFHKIVRSLVKSGADVTFTRRDDNMRAIHAAASSGNVKCVAALIEVGANPNSLWDPPYLETGETNKKPTPTGITPLHIASVNGFAEIVDFLITSGANIESRDSNGKTAIIYAASDKSNLAAVQVLVRRGADCTVRGRTGTSAIHEAAKHDNQKMVMLLLKEGAEAENERNSKGETAVDINPQLFSQKKYERYLRSDTRTYLKYQVKIKK